MYIQVYIFVYYYLLHVILCTRVTNLLSLYCGARVYESVFVQVPWELEHENTKTIYVTVNTRVAYLLLVTMHGLLVTMYKKYK